ncbi:unnamed protein product [Rotaria sp. Silwood1]|nr:unnamed protein product [Rotaria sp. Silwood1]CAF4848142.1 unnamed protein product [Rotaria sp. Silwood1]
MLFIGESITTSRSPSTMDMSSAETIKFNPIEVYEFLKDINQDFPIKYLETSCLKSELDSKQRDICNLLIYAYQDRIKQLSNESEPMIEAKQQEIKDSQQQNCKEHNC